MRRVAVPLNLTPATARPREGRAVALSGPTMGVAWSLTARAPDGVPDPAIRAAVQAACDTVVGQMSSWEPDSDLSRYNRAAAGTWIAAPAHLLTVVQAALDAAALSHGAFDPTVGGLTDLWGFGPAGPVAGRPSPEALAGSPVGWRDLKVDAQGARLFQPGGLRLDLSGIAKGYGVDLAARAVEALGVRDYLLEIGGELRGAGVKGDGEPWWVEIEAPPTAEPGEPPILVALHGLSIATSGDWRRFWSQGERRYSHTLDPATRAPTDGPLAAVSVLHPDCMQADALCTALMVMGSAAEAFAAHHDIAAHLVVRAGDGLSERVSPALARMLD